MATITAAPAIPAPATTDIVGRRWSADHAPQGPLRTHRHCGAVVLEVSAHTVSWQGVESLLRTMLTATMGPDISYELHTQGSAASGSTRVLTLVVWDVGALALTVLGRRLELAIESRVPWAAVVTGCAVGRDTAPEQLIVRAHRAVGRRRAERARRRVRLGAAPMHPAT